MSLETTLADPAAVGVSPARLDDARALMQRQFDDGRSPMLVAVVARRGQVVFTHSVGDARPDGPPLTVDSVFPIASQTKPMTAAVVLALVERGLIGLNEPAAVHVPELAEAGADQVMVNQFLTHTTGWHEDDVLLRTAEVFEELVAGDDELDVIARIMLRPGLSTPRRTVAGEIMQYCNFNYSLLGEIVRRVTGGTLDAAMREHVFDPVGMTSSAVIVDDELAARVVERPEGLPFTDASPDTVISFQGDEWRASDDGASGVHASAVDCARFAQMVLDGGRVGERRVLSRDAVRTMTTDQIPGVPAEVFEFELAEAHWGYGFGVAGTESFARYRGGTTGPRALHHGGAGGIHHWIDPDDGVVGVYFEMVTEWDEDRAGNASWAAHRFEDVITAAVID